MENHSLNPNLRISFFNLIFKISMTASERIKVNVIEESWKEFSNLLKRALTDIWTFVSSSASYCFHGFSDFLVFFRFLLKNDIIKDHHRSKILSECYKLCTVCIDAFMPAGHGTMNQRVAILIALATKCLVLDQASFGF